MFWWVPSSAKKRPSSQLSTKSAAQSVQAQQPQLQHEEKYTTHEQDVIAEKDIKIRELADTVKVQFIYCFLLPNGYSYLKQKLTSWIYW